MDTGPVLWITKRLRLVDLIDKAKKKCGRVEVLLF